MKGKNTIYSKPFAWAIILGILFYQDAITAFFKPVSYLDEVMAIAFFIYFIYNAKTIDKNQLKICVLILVLFLVGIVGNLTAGVTTTIKDVLYDAFNIFKFIFAVLGALIYFEKFKRKKQLMSYLNCMVGFSVIVASIFMIANFVTDVGMYTDYRYGIRTYNFVFSRVGGFYSACVIWLIVLTANRFYRKDNRILILLTLINMCATLRSRAIAFALLYVILYYVFLIKKDGKLKWWYFPPVFLSLVLIARDQLQYYFSGERARNVLLKYGIITAKRNFPFGGGFATYGTAVARDSYSQLYSRYGFSNVWGLSKDNVDFLTDNYWPAVIGEFGIIGVILMLVLLIDIFRILLRRAANQYSRVCVWFAYATLVISSTASSSFFSCTQLMIFVCIIVNIGGREFNG